MKLRYHHFHLPIKLLIIILIPLAIILGVTSYLLYDESTYQQEFRKVGTYDRVPNADQVLNSILDFFQGKDKPENLTAAETSHLYDVRSVINFFTIFFYIIIITKLTLFGLLIFHANKPAEDLIHITSGAGILTLVITLSLALVNFDQLFTAFHNLLFPEGSWLFSESSMLIKLFPKEFFIHFSRHIAKNTLFASGFMLTFSLILWLVTRKE